MYELPVSDCTELTRSAKYQIKGELGQWRYSYEEFGGRSTYYTFWRYDSLRPPTRVPAHRFPEDGDHLPAGDPLAEPDSYLSRILEQDRP